MSFYEKYDDNKYNELVVLDEEEGTTQKVYQKCVPIGGKKGDDMFSTVYEGGMWF